MQMKKAILIFVSVVLLVLILVAAQFFYTNLRGAGPALLPVEDDIAQLIDEANQQPTNTNSSEGEDRGDPETINTTEFPLKLQNGMQMQVFARNMGKVRDLFLAPNGMILATNMDGGTIAGFNDEDKNGQAESFEILARGLYNPHGLASRCTDADSGFCTLYVAEENAITAFDFDLESGELFNKKTVVSIPEGSRHSTRSIVFLDENSPEMLVSIGSNCDVCYEPNPLHGSVQLLNVDTGELRPYATGLRNAVFMDTHPRTGAVYVTEMGRDRLGDDLPPDEINVITDGRSYGWPVCYGKNIHDTVFDKNTYIKNPCEEPDQYPSFIDLQAHSAPLGLDFVPTDGWPADWQGDLIVAYHGSWNRSVPTGYKLVRIDLTENGTFDGAITDFISGWLTDSGGSLGRPVDVLMLDGGIMYISDDKTGLIYSVVIDERIL